MNGNNINYIQTIINELELKILSKEKKERKEEKIINLSPKREEPKTSFSRLLFHLFLFWLFKEIYSIYIKKEGKNNETCTDLIVINEIHYKFYKIKKDLYSLMNDNMLLYFDNFSFFIILILDTLLPGIGSIIIAIFYKRKYIFTFGVHQLLTYFYFILWIKSINEKEMM